MEDMGKANAQRPMTEAGTPEDSGETISIPAEFLQGTKFKAGDELVLKVITADEEGLEVAYAKKPAGGDKEDAKDASGTDEELDSINDGY